MSRALGIRLVDGPLTGVRCPLFQTSANRSGEPAPSRFEQIDADILAAPTWQSTAGT